MKTNIEKLHEFVSKLDKLQFEKTENLDWIKMSSGEPSSGISLLSINLVSVMSWKFEADSVSYEHAHDSSEWLLIYEGSVYFSCEVSNEVIISNNCVEKDGNYKLYAGDFVYIPAGIAHIVSSVDGAKMIVVTIPRAEEFPR